MSTRDKLIVLIVAIALIVIGITSFFLLSRSSNEVSTIFGRIDNPEITSLIRLRINILAIDFQIITEMPKTAKVFKISERQISRKDAISMAAKFGFKSEPKGGSILSWVQKNQSLDIDLGNNRLDYKNTKVKILRGKFSEKELTTKANNFIKDKGLSTEDLIADTKNVRLIEALGDELGFTTDSSKSVFLEIGFNRKISEYILFYPNPTEPTATVILNNKGQVFKFSYNFTKINEVTIGTYPIIDISKINTADLAKFGILVAPGEGENTFDSKLLQDIIVEDASLGYLDDKRVSFVQPVYILRGFSEIGNEITAVIIYYPALEGRWLK